MKKSILLTIIGFTVITGFGQYMPLHFLNSLTDYPVASNQGGQVVANDSMFYMLRYGGIQYININTGKVKYKWTGCYHALAIIPDVQGGFLLLKDNSQLLRYNPQNDSLIDISPPGHYVSKMAESATKIWVLADNGSLGIYNGQNWQFVSSGIYFGEELLAKNDNTVYFTNQMESEIMRYQNGAVNDSFCAIPYYYNLFSWDIDTRGNIWIGDTTRLLQIDSSGNKVIFDASNSPIQVEPYSTVLTDLSGNVWCTGRYRNIYKFDYQNWTTFNLPGNYTISNSGIDKYTGKVFALSFDSLYVLQNGVFKSYYFGNMPYQNITAMNTNSIATDQGIFNYSIYNYLTHYTPTAFTDTTIFGNPYALDVTCLAQSTTWDGSYGTHHGIYANTWAIDNDLLPDSNINCIYNISGTYYIGTNKGLCIYNQGFYNTFDRSNSPLPSNKITCITGGEQQYMGATPLYVGTDKGIAIYANGAWKGYDTSVVHLSNFYVSSISPNVLNDTDIWITTLGSGLVRLNINGTYQVLNAENGGIADDTLYYVFSFELGDCGEATILGTCSHGVAIFASYYDSIAFTYDTSQFHQSRFYSIDQNGDVIVATDAGLLVGSPCGSVKSVPSPVSSLKWTTQGDLLDIYLPDTYSGKAKLTLCDVKGCEVGAKTTDVAAGNAVPMEISRLSAGIYIVQANLNGQLLQTKVVITK